MSPALKIVVGGVVAVVLFGGIVGAWWVMNLANGGGAKDAIRKYLKENSQSGEWEEVQWWDAVPSKGSRVLKESAKAGDRRFLAYIRNFDDSYSGVDTDGKCLRLSMRFSEPSGKRLVDWTFVVDRNAKVVVASETIDLLLPGESISEQQTRLSETPSLSADVQASRRAAQEQEGLRKFIKGMADGKIGQNP